MGLPHSPFQIQWSRTRLLLFYFYFRSADSFVRFVQCGHCAIAHHSTCIFVFHMCILRSGTRGGIVFGVPVHSSHREVKVFHRIPFKPFRMCAQYWNWYWNKGQATTIDNVLQRTTPFEYHQLKSVQNSKHVVQNFSDWFIHTYHLTQCIIVHRRRHTILSQSSP